MRLNDNPENVEHKKETQKDPIDPKEDLIDTDKECDCCGYCFNCLAMFWSDFV